MFGAMEKETLNGLKNDFCNSMVSSDLKYNGSEVLRASHSEIQQVSSDQTWNLMIQSSFIGTSIMACTL